MQREAGDDQDEEAGEQDQVLRALVRGHADDGVRLRAAAGDELGAPENRVVQQHSADDEQNERNVEPAHVADGAGSAVGCLAAVGVDVDLVEGELLGNALVALAAGSVEVGGVDGGARIAGRQDVVNAVATGAVGDDDRTALRSEAVVAVVISGDAVADDAELLGEAHALMTAGAGVAREVLAGDRGVGIAGRLDGVDAVAIGADGGERVAARDGLAVNALGEDGLHAGVALAAGAGDVELVDQRLGIVGGQNLVRAVAVGADGGLLRAVLDRAAVDALLVADEGLVAVAGRLHQELLAVAGAAGGGNVGVIDGRLGIGCRQNGVRVAVAIGAGGGNGSVGLARGGVVAVRVGGLRVGVAAGAGDLGGCLIVRRGLDVLVAVDAGEHAARGWRRAPCRRRWRHWCACRPRMACGSEWQARHSASLGLGWARTRRAGRRRRRTAG